EEGGEQRVVETAVVGGGDLVAQGLGLFGVQLHGESASGGGGVGSVRAIERQRPRQGAGSVEPVVPPSDRRGGPRVLGEARGPLGEGGRDRQQSRLGGPQGGLQVGQQDAPGGVVGDQRVEDEQQLLRARSGGEEERAQRRSLRQITALPESADRGLQRAAPPRFGQRREVDAGQERFRMIRRRAGLVPVTGFVAVE